MFSGLTLQHWVSDNVANINYIVVKNIIIIIIIYDTPCILLVRRFEREGRHLQIVLVNALNGLNEMLFQV